MQNIRGLQGKCVRTRTQRDPTVLCVCSAFHTSQLQNSSLADADVTQEHTCAHSVHEQNAAMTRVKAACLAK